MYIVLSIGKCRERINSDWIVAKFIFLEVSIGKKVFGQNPWNRKMKRHSGRKFSQQHLLNFFFQKNEFSDDSIRVNSVSTFSSTERNKLNLWLIGLACFSSMSRVFWPKNFCLTDIWSTQNQNGLINELTNWLLTKWQGQYWW